MNGRLVKICFCAVIMLLTARYKACAGTPQVQVKVILISVSGDSTVLSPGDNATGKLNVPLRGYFISSLTTDDGKDYVMFPQWTIKRMEAESPEYENYLQRTENETEFEFSDYGKYKVDFAWSYREKDATATVPGADVQSMYFTIDDSEIRLFNAFSPNGDGINDVYKIYVRSIVRMDIAIFNRWGQTITTLSGKMEDILPTDAEAENDGGYTFQIWDGKHNGSVVNDGVYFINVKATGAGGRTFQEKGDINVLKGLGEGN